MLRSRDPVPAEKHRLLVVMPLWLAKLWRVALVGLVLAIVLRLRQAPGGLTPPFSSQPPTWAVAGALLLWYAGAWAQATPHPELLAQLRERLTTPPPCDPHCASLAQAKIAAAGERLELPLTAHAGATVAVPGPQRGHGRGAAVVCGPHGRAAAARGWELLYHGRGLAPRARARDLLGHRLHPSWAATGTSPEDMQAFTRASRK